MIHLFGDLKNLSALYELKHLTPEQIKKRVCVIDKLPHYLRKENFTKRLCFDETNEKLYWEYDEIVQETVTENLPQSE
jgi:hypothetical protein